MRTIIAGGHGKIALLLTRQLAEGGHDPVGIVRNVDHVAEVESAGGRALLIDLARTSVEQLAEHLDGADAVVFAAGAGGSGGPERTLAVDRDSAVLVADAAEAAGVTRFVLVSSMGADDFDPQRAELSSADLDTFQLYLRAKSEADASVRSHSGLEWTIVRPGALTDDPATGLVAVGRTTERGSISRADVAAVIATALTEGTAVRTQFEVIAGELPISDALAAIRY